MSYQVLDRDELTAKAPPDPPDEKAQLAAALDQMESEGWQLAGTVPGTNPLFVFHRDDHSRRMGNMR